MNRKPGPAETLMGNMTFPTKFTLVSILFLIPLVLTLVLYWQESSQNINRLSSELRGMKLINQLEPVLIAAGEHRGLTHASLNGDNSVGGQLSSVRSKLNQNIGELQTLSGQLDAPSNLSSSIAKLQQQWQGLAASNGGDAQQRFDQHNEMIKQIRKLFVEVSRSYQLELDSDGETTFLINMAVTELPTVVDESGKLRDAATGVAAMGRFTPDSFIYLSNQLNQVKPAVAELAAHSDHRFSFSSGDQLQREITAASQKLGELQQFVKSRVIDPDSINVNGSQVFGTGSQNLKPVIDLYTHMMPMLEMLIQQRLERLELHRNLVLAVILLTVGAAIYLFIGFYRYTMCTVNNFSQQAALLAAGDLSVRLEPRGNDEMCAVTDGFNKVADGFQQLVRQTVSSTELVAKAATAMNTESGQTLQGAAQQKQEADAIAMAISDLAHSAEDIAAHSAVAAESAQRADEMATEGRNVVQDTARSFTGMMDEVARTSEVIGQLDKDVQAIGDISTVIREIAEQTNLLALNAAIEAARAGEQGRGFAVVADEVRNLAQRTQSSTEEIQQTIESLQSCTRDSVELMTSTHSQVSANVEEIDKAGELLQSIDDIVADMNQKNAQIASAVQAQNQLVERLQGNITTVADVADTTECSARQSASLAEDMSHSSSQLQQSLSAFRIS